VASAFSTPKVPEPCGRQLGPHRPLPAILRERACTLFVSNSVSVISHAADVSGSVLAIGTKWRVYCAISAALHGSSFDLTAAISIIDLKFC
jgi:hypothetical protein